ncbi:Cupin 2 conserved barrel domain protein [Enhygromyxa salina]|uniref:Cupin 2 conserved barrel domain protein n=1 Tax=Enhygromyxa salina TaxID=215803 RepID=A0A0C1ZDD4_9BACT|nr:cupin domain-containing protein [Enhygromyxa salina]KIG15669.1 Cupin 2 conserved barrel domain protein [Enhygromyxa salina]
MSKQRQPKDYIVRSSELGTSNEMHVSHPLNDRSEVFMTRLSDPTGLSHVGVSIARVPPGKESFALHVHSVQEEWIFVLSGQGTVQIDDEQLELRAGDFVGFPPNGPAHVIRNSSDTDLVYLQGGDRRTGDIGRFPGLGLVTYQHDEGHMALIPEDKVEIRPFSDWVAKG